MKTISASWLFEAALLERVSFDTLFRYSEPKRVVRSKTVTGPPLGVNASNDVEMWNFNFKSYPSTTGRRHAGYVRFYKPRIRNTPLEKAQCSVDCDCEDFRYRWAWANKQKGSSEVGPRSLNKAWNRAPRITNPQAKIGLCKHALSLTNFIYGNYGKFTARGEAPEKAMDRLVAASANVTVPIETSKGRETQRRQDVEAARRGDVQRVAPASPVTLAQAAPRRDWGGTGGTPTVIPPVTRLPARGTRPVAATPAKLSRPTPTVRQAPTVAPAPQVWMRRAPPRREDAVVSAMSTKTLLQEADAAMADTEKMMAGASAAEPKMDGGGDLMSLVREIRDMLAKLIDGGETDEAPAEDAEPAEEPVIPSDAKRVEQEA